MKIRPVVFVWKEMSDPETGDLMMVMVPQPRYVVMAGRQFHADEEYPLAIIETRSRASHSHYFACVNEGFKNIPENIAARWQEPDHLRKWALIETGWFDEQEFQFESKKEAENNAKKFVAFCRAHDTYVRVHVSGKKIIVRSPKSQAAAAMGKEAFEKSKHDVLDLIEHMVDVPTGTLKKQAGRNG